MASNILSSSNTYILSVNSRRQVQELEGVSKFNVFPFEHISFSNRFQLTNEVSSLLKDIISLENYELIREDKYSFLHNVCGKLDANSIVRELSLLKAKSIIADSGTELFKFRNDGSYSLYLDQEANKKISSIASQLENKADILVGIMLDFNFDSAKIKDIVLNEVRNLLILNYNNTILPSFIIMNIENLSELNICLSLSLLSEFSIPIFIQLTFNQIDLVSEFLVKCEKVYMSSIEGNRYYNAKLKLFSDFLKKFVFVLSSDILGNEYVFEGLQGFELEYRLSATILSILERGCNVILGVQDKDEFLNNKLKKHNLKQTQKFQEYFNATNDYNHPFKTQKIKLILEIQAKFPEQVLLSNNISFLIEHSLFGGKGYNLIDSHTQKLTDPSNNLLVNLKKVAIKIFSWWKLPEKEEKKVDMITCSFCNSLKPDNSDVIRKNEFIFCDVVCLSKYNKSKATKK